MYVTYYFFQQSVIIDGMKMLLKDLVNFKMSYTDHISHALRTSTLEVCSPDSPLLTIYWKSPQNIERDEKL